MIERAVAQIVRTCCRAPVLTIVMAAMLTSAAIFYLVLNFAINTDTDQLISSKLPWRQNEVQFDRTFPQQTDTLLVVVDGATPELTESAARQLTAALAKQPQHIEGVSRPDAGAFFQRNGLLFLSLDEVRRTTEQLIRAQPFLATIAADPTLRGLADALRFIPEGVKEGRVELKDFAAPLGRLCTALESLLQGQQAAFSWSELMTGEAPPPSELRRFIRVKPVLDFTDLEPGAAASETIRRTAAALSLTPEHGVRVRLTGAIAMADEEFATVSDGALINIVLTALAVLLILWFALRSRRMVLAVMLCLFAGLAITAAIGLALVGAFNLISIAFAVLFIGIGVDFCIQMAIRYRQERHSRKDLEPALMAAAAGIGTPLALAAAASAAGFYAFLPTDFLGVSELGLIAGTGMIIAFIVSITLLPALLVTLKPKSEAKEVGYRQLAPVDRFLGRHRIPILLLTGLVVVGGLPLLANLKFDFNPLNLRSAKVESVSTLLDLMKDPATSANAANILAPSLADAKAIAAKFEANPEVYRVATLDSFVPEHQDEKLALIGDAADILGPAFDLPDMKPAPTDAESKAALIETAAAYRNMSGEGTDRSLTSRLAGALNKLANADKTTRTRVAASLLGGFQIRLSQIREALRPEHISLGSLPQDLREEWIAKDGRARVEITPKGDQTDNETMRRFAAAVLAVAPDATGTPILIQQSARTIVNAFLEAGGFALASITLILFVVLRRASDVALTMVPLLFAGVVTLELTVLIGLPLNFANIIALPLLLGVGVAFKIYYVLAWRGGASSMLASPLTRAVLFSAATTATAFISLWMSNHPGTSSMGKLLSLSLVSTLAAAVLFQPMLMGPPRAVKQPN